MLSKALTNWFDCTGSPLPVAVAGVVTVIVVGLEDVSLNVFQILCFLCFSLLLLLLSLAEVVWMFPACCDLLSPTSKCSPVSPISTGLLPTTYKSKRGDR